MTIKVCKLRFDAELAVYKEITEAGLEHLRKEIERIVRQSGIYSNFMIGQNQIELSEKKK